MRMSGAFELMRLTHRRHALILTYHRFRSGPRGGAPDGLEDMKTPAKTFAEQLGYLTKRYNIVPLRQIAESICCHEQTPPSLAAITIDDGYRDAYEIAYPLLRRFGAPATLFLPTGFIDRLVWIWTDKTRFLVGQAVSRRFTPLRMNFNGSQLRIELDGATSSRDASERINSILKRLPEEVKEEAIERLAGALGVELPEKPPDEFG